jgi:hypothetical protein
MGEANSVNTFLRQHKSTSSRITVDPHQNHRPSQASSHAPQLASRLVCCTAAASAPVRYNFKTKVRFNLLILSRSAPNRLLPQPWQVASLSRLFLHPADTLLFRALLQRYDFSFLRAMLPLYYPHSRANSCLRLALRCPDGLRWEIYKLVSGYIHTHRSRVQRNFAAFFTIASD